MKISDDQLVHNLELLRHGGADAIVLFINVTREIYETGSAEDLDSWVAVASPCLPEADRHAAIGLLLRAFFGDYEMVDGDHETIQ